MNRFEQAVHECMLPTCALLGETTKPLRRVVLHNFWRHVHLDRHWVLEEQAVA